MASRNVLVEALKERGREYRKQLKAVRRQASEQAVHDLRASIRRLRLALEAAAFFCSASRTEKLSAPLKDQLDFTDELRDVQVMLADLSHSHQQLPALRSLQQDLQDREAALGAQARELSGRLDLPEFTQRLQAICASLEGLPHRQLMDGLLQAVDSAYGDAMHHYAALDPSQPASLHQVRIGLRKFRYMLEIPAPLLTGLPASHLDRIHDYQAQMGLIQDANTFLDLAQASSSEQAGLESIHSFYQDRMSSALSHYLQSKDDIKTFWRPTPAHPFPWAAREIWKGQRFMDLYIIRHAIAVEPGTPGNEDDSQRPLTGKGRKKMKKIARAIDNLGIAFDAVISSPYTRARETAEILVDRLKLEDKLTFSDALIPPGNFEHLVEELGRNYDGGSLALVGHEPMLSQFIGWLATGGGSMSVALKKGGLCYLKADDLAGQRRATLKWLLTPATMIAMNA